MPTLLLEVFSEEIPARMQRAASMELANRFSSLLSDLGITPASTPQSFVTPRRLAVMLEALPTELPAREEEKRGPRLGAPDAAIDGFCRSAAITRDQLEARGEGKDAFYFATIRHPARPLAEALAEPISKAIASFPWPKSMRWGSGDATWVRPLRSILCLLDGETIPVTYAGVTASNQSFGHRFMAPEAITITHANDYPDILATRHVRLDSHARASLILAEATALASQLGGHLVEDAALLEETAGLAEWPVVLSGKIDQRFMAVPKEVLITSMKSHQKYFSIVDAEGKLLPHFIFVANIAAADGGQAIIHGNERVLRARLSDAEFFWNQDRKQPLEYWNQKLETVTYHAKLGTVADKTRRLQALATTLPLPRGERAGVRGENSLVRGENSLVRGENNPTIGDLLARAASLAKADLATGMVGEFPELQGIMGGYYALHSGEAPEIAHAIRDHYKPQGQGDPCPTAPLSIALALADKLDSLTGLWLAGEKPTGSGDPYGLRRMALGILRLILSNSLRLPLRQALAASLSTYPTQLTSNQTAVIEELLTFFTDRLKIMLKDEGIRHDILAAVFDQGQDDDILRLTQRARSLRDFLARPEGQPLLAGYRRAMGIVKQEEQKDNTRYQGQPTATSLEASEEQQLHTTLLTLSGTLKPLLDEERFTEAMNHMASLKDPLDAFFNHVTVNSPKPELRQNRLHLLATAGALFHQLANFDKLEA